MTHVDNSSSKHSSTVDDEEAGYEIEKLTDSSLSKCLSSYILGGYVPREDGINLRPDDQNFRYLLWKAMLEFSDEAESKSRDFILQFIRFARYNKFVHVLYCTAHKNSNVY